MSTIKLIDAIKGVEHEKFILPNFQREYTYDRSKQKNLITSVLSFIPLGAIMTLEGEPQMMSYRNIGRRSGALTRTVSRPQVHFVLDGQQRLTTLWSCFTDVFHGHSLAERNELKASLSPKLWNRWNLRLVPEDNEDDIFGWIFLKVSLDELRRLNPEDLEPRIDCDRSLVGNEVWPWVDGGVIDMPHYASTAAYDIKRRRVIESRGLLPLHKLFDGQSFLRDIGRHRKMELMNQLELIFENSTSFSGCSDDAKNLLEKLINVKDEDTFNNHRTSAVRMQALDHRVDRWVTEIDKYIREVAEQVLFEIKLDESDLGKANVIFDVINQSGAKLTVFDLFCAKHPSIKIRTDVQELLDSYSDSLALLTTDRTPEKKYLDLFMNTLRAVHYAEGPSAHKKQFAKAIKGDVFRIDGDFVRRRVIHCAESVARAMEFAQNRLGIRKLSEVPYLLQLLPIAVGYSLSDNAPTPSDLAFFEYNYWFSIFSGRYREAQNKTVGEDLIFIYDRMIGGQIGIHSSMTLSGPWGQKILNYSGYNDREFLVTNSNDDSVGDGVKKSIIQFVLSLEPNDFPSQPSNNPVAQLSASDDSLELHHIVPIATKRTVQKSSNEIRKEGGAINSPLNLTYISKDSNRFLGSMPLQTYIGSLDTMTLLDHCLGTVGIVPYDPADPDQLRNWLEGRYHCIQQRLLTKLRELLHHI